MKQKSSFRFLKSLSLFVALGLPVTYSRSGFATVDAHDRVYLVVRDIQSEEFFVERAPIIGCYGLPKSPHLQQFTAEYKVTSNIGCGGPVAHDNINYLTCAKVVSSEESSDYTGFSRVVLNIAKCDAKSDANFLKTLRSAARLNFAPKKGDFHLELVTQ